MSKDFNVFIKSENGNLFKLDINYEMSVKDLKNKIKQKLNQNYNQFDDVFISIGTKMINDQKLNLKVTDLDIYKDSTIFTYPRLKGG